jgi:molybdopterin synthase catalytic subunit
MRIWRNRPVMNIENMISTLKGRPDFNKMGMIASHLGIVRGTALDGTPVKALEIRFDRDRLNIIRSDIKELNGIVDVLIEVREGRLEVGEEIMAVVVGGDVREHVFSALIKTVDRIKKEASFKKEF